MEYRDIYDQNKKRTGKVNAKDSPLLPGEYILVIGCWVIDHQGNIFVTKRSPEKRFAPNLWENTGGHAMAGEDGPEAILRELMEETGISASREDLILIHEDQSEDSFSEEYVILKDFPLSDVILQEGETCDCAWISEEKWEAMLENGEIAPSINEKIQPFKQKLLDVIHAQKQSAC